MPKSLTKLQKARWYKLQKAREDAIDAIFARMTDVRFSDCYDIAPIPLQRAYDSACGNLWDFERKMISEGRGWEGQLGHFVPNF